MAQYTNALKACPVIIWPDGSWTFWATQTCADGKPEYSKPELSRAGHRLASLTLKDLSAPVSSPWHHVAYMYLQLQHSRMSTNYTISMVMMLRRLSLLRQNRMQPAL